MKITILALFILFTLSIKQLLEGAQNSPNQVIDTSGKKLKAGTNYYILHVPSSKCTNFGGSICKGGNINGFVLAQIVPNKTCPLDVLVVEKHYGQPVVFTPINQKNSAIIHVSTDLNINFSFKTSCPQSSVWKIDQFDRLTRKWFVTTGGVLGNPSWRTISSWFKIEKYENDYKLVSCPSFCVYCRVQCRDVGLYEDQNGNKRLALTDTPYKVRFREAAKV